MDKIKNDKMGLHTNIVDKVNELVEGYNEIMKRLDMMIWKVYGVDGEKIKKRLDNLDNDVMKRVEEHIDDYHYIRDKDNMV